MSIFFAPALQEAHTHYQLSEEESKHCNRVLRLKEGARIELVNGIGLHAVAVLKDAHPKRSLLEIESIVQHAPTPTLHIAIAPTKNMDRIEWFLEKSTELGLSKLTFLVCDHNERKHVNMDRLEKIAIAAMKQSKRFYLPQIEPLEPFADFVKKHPRAYFGHCAEGSKIPLKNLKTEYPFLIGPEGDFSSQEIELALKSGYQAVHMSEFRLRTETAALLATAALLS